MKTLTLILALAVSLLAACEVDDPIATDKDASIMTDGGDRDGGSAMCSLTNESCATQACCSGLICDGPSSFCTCPSDTQSLDGTPCQGEGERCGACNPDPCSPCTLAECVGGTWQVTTSEPPPSCFPDGGTSVIVCDMMPITFPDFDRSCTTAADCVAVQHQVDCCGTTHATGIAATAEGGFDAAEATCRGMFPACRCAPQPTMADDGTGGNLGDEWVECVDNVCTSSFGLRDGAECEGSGDTCGAGLSCCYPCGIPGCTDICEPTCDPGNPACADGCLLRP